MEVPRKEEKEQAETKKKVAEGFNEASEKGQSHSMYHGYVIITGPKVQ